MSVKIGRNDPCWCGSGKKYKACHQAFDERIAMIASQGHIVPTHDLIKNADQIAGIKESCKINIAVLDYIEKHIHEGMNTAEIDKIVYDMTTEMGGIPAPLNYEGYPYSVCTSVNDQVCHGFPSKDVILKTDKSRSSYYNYYTNKKWGEASSYHLCVDSGKFGIDGSVKAIVEAIKIFESTL